MKYDLDNIHWQEFEQISFRILQNIISPAVQFLEGGNDKGRDVIYKGPSNDFRKEWDDNWLIQVKHKSTKSKGETIALNSLTSKLEEELSKVFIKNKLNVDNYILMTNLIMPPKYYDKLSEIFEKFRKDKKIKCKNFDIISYRHVESSIDVLDEVKWTFPNIISHPDFQILIQSAVNFHMETRNRAWVNGILKLKPKFVYTSFFEKADKKLKNYNCIILSGPPKSGKTFNAEILALNYGLHKNYQPIRIDNPEEIEKIFNEKISQIFICDDAFGKHALSYRADEWERKIETIFNIADERHLFIFTSKEYILRGFINNDNEDVKTYLKKIIVESHDYSNTEKKSLLARYTTLSDLTQKEKNTILYAEELLIKHKNFSPETIRAFFSNIPAKKSKKILDLLIEHIEKPDAYLSVVFFKLERVKQAALLSVLCSLDNAISEIYRTFELICKDLDIKDLLSYQIEFDELDDSILRILKSDGVEEINFYHPSMQKFLITLLVDADEGIIREVALRNINLTILELSIIKSKNKSLFPLRSINLINIKKGDLAKLNVGLERLLVNSQLRIFHIVWMLRWINNDEHSLNLKVTDKPLFDELKEMLSTLIAFLSDADFFYYHKNESCDRWAELILVLKLVSTSFGIDKSILDFTYLSDLVNEKRSDPLNWKVVFRVLSVTNDEFIRKLVDEKWLNKFYTETKDELYKLGCELFGRDFPEFKEYHKEKLKNHSLKKRKEDPNKFWYPRYLICEEKIKYLKEVQGFETGKILLERFIGPFSELKKISEYAKNRHRYLVSKGWWKD